MTSFIIDITHTMFRFRIPFKEKMNVYRSLNNIFSSHMIDLHLTLTFSFSGLWSSVSPAAAKALYYFFSAVSYYGLIQCISFV